LRRLTAIIITPFVAAVFLTGCTQGEKKIMLRYKFEPGLKLSYEQVSKRRTRVTQADSTIKESSMTFEMKIEQLVERIFSDSTAEIAEVSAWTVERPSKEDFSVTETVEESRELVLQVRPNGKVLEVKFRHDENYSHIRYMRNYYEQGMPVFPSHEVSPGHTWTQTTKVVLPEEPMEASMTYKVLSLVREAGYDCAVIEYGGDLIIPLEPNPQDSVPSSGLDRIRTTGFLYFAYKEGMIVLQREQWLIDRYRRKTHDGKTKEYKEAVELDIDYMLKERTIVDSLAL
jgi:hypothetical protein